MIPVVPAMTPFTPIGQYPYQRPPYPYPVQGPYNLYRNTVYRLLRIPVSIVKRTITPEETPALPIEGNDHIRRLQYPFVDVAVSLDPFFGANDEVPFILP